MEISVVSTNRRSLTNLAEREVEAVLELEGLSEYIGIFQDYLHIKNNLSADSQFTALQWLSRQPGLEAVKKSLEHSETERIVKGGSGVADGEEKSSCCCTNDIVCVCTHGHEKNQDMDKIGAEEEKNISSNDLIAIIAHRATKKYQTARMKSNIWNNIWQIEGIGLREEIRWNLDVNQNFKALLKWYEQRLEFFNSGEVVMWLTGAVITLQEGKKNKKDIEKLSDIIDDSTPQLNLSTVDRNLLIAGGYTGAGIRGEIPNDLASLYTRLISDGVMSSFLAAESLPMPPYDTWADNMYTQIMIGTYHNKLIALMQRFNVKIPEDFKVGDTLANLAISAEKKKLILAQITQEREARRPNNCSHVRLIRDLGQGTATFEEVAQMAGEIVGGKVICVACKSQLMCEHEFNYYKGLDYNKFAIPSEYYDFCSSCGAIIRDRTLNFATPAVEYTQDMMTIISYQYNLIKRHLTFPITVSEKNIFRSMLNGVYEDVMTIVGGLDKMRGLSAIEYDDRLIIHVYIYVWVYLLYLIELHGLGIVINMTTDNVKLGKKAPLSSAKLKPIEKVMRIMDRDLRIITNRQPTISLKNILNAALNNYFKGGKKAGVTKNHGLSPAETDMLWNMITYNPFITQGAIKAKLIVKAGQVDVKALWDSVTAQNDVHSYMLAARRANITQKTMSDVFDWSLEKEPTEIKVRAARMSVNMRENFVGPMTLLGDPQKGLSNMRKVQLIEGNGKLRKFVKVVYRGPNGEITDVNRPVDRAVKIVDILDAVGESIIEKVRDRSKILENTDEDEPSILTLPVLAPGTLKIAETDLAVLRKGLTTEFKTTEKLFQYYGATDGIDEDLIKSGKATQKWTLFRLGRLIELISLYISKMNTNMNETTKGYIKTFIRWAFLAAKQEPEMIKDLIITAINIIVEYIMSHEPTKEVLMRRQSQMMKAVNITSSLLRIYLDRKEDDGLEVYDADADDKIEQKTADIYKNVDYDGENDEDQIEAMDAS
jgi:hypothetical protein